LKGEFLRKGESLRMTSSDKRDWRQICQEVVQERNPEKMDALLAELLDILEERSIARSKQPSTSER